MKIYCSCCDKVQPVRVDNCLDANTNEPFQDIVCNECDLVIASGIGITVPPSLETAVGTAYKTGWEHGKAKESKACAKLCEEIGEESDSFTRDILRSTAEVIRARGQACNCAEAIRKRSST